MFMDLDYEKLTDGTDKSINFQTRGNNGGIQKGQCEQRYGPMPIEGGWYDLMFDPALSLVGSKASDHSPGRPISGIFWCRGTMLSDQLQGAGLKEVFCADNLASKLNVCRLNLWH